MIRVAAMAGLTFWAGTTLVLSRLRWFSRRPLTDRLRPYEPGGLAAPDRTGILSVESFSEVIGPLARTVGDHVAKAVGITDSLESRLERIHSPLSPTEFRLRQAAWGAGGLVAGAALAVGLTAPPLLGLLVIVGSPALAVLVIEQQLATHSDRRKRRVFLELPVVAEQLGMLVSAGYSLGSAITRLADRGQGATGADLRRVVTRMRQGVAETEALREWAALADVDAVDRLVSVLALNREASDLGRLISAEARAIRRAVQRELLEQIERRGQQVWIPVTVAALVPGAIFIAIPFVRALSAFGVS